MGIRIYKPTSPGRRISSVDDFSDITKWEPEKSLIVIKKRKAGRNNQGKITVRHRGGGAKRFYRIIDFKRLRLDIPATVAAIEYDPNRNARIALLQYEDGVKAYIIAPNGLSVGATVLSSKEKIDISVGNRLLLKHIPAGIMVYELEINPGRGAQIVRSAGLGAKIMSVEGDYALIKLPSGEIRKFSTLCMATVGQVGNADYRLIRWGKAGRKRHLGWRPTVRGKVMNPVDHPHGGGEGHTPIGMKHPKTPQGKPALGVRTRKKKPSDRLITQRRYAKK